MAEHVATTDSGIYWPHILAIEEVMKRYNAFLFIRPTEYDSTVLIEAGFATKNMDIHDKSSNWGPMAGMVPCDPYFSKKMDAAAPDANIKPHKHKQAYAVELTMEPALVSKMLGRNKIKKLDGMWAVKGRAVTTTRNPAPGVAFYQGAGPKATMSFCIQEKKVYWVNWSNPQKTSGTLVPLWVWAYSIGGRLTPVTGDYDMWMVAPHASVGLNHMLSDLTVDPEGHGESTASTFTQRLVKSLNGTCKWKAPRTCQVFNHGAEAQNYGFTQALDPKLAMFTAAGTSRMVAIWEMPRIMADLEAMGYMVIYNRRYAELDARLMGRSTIKELARIELKQKAIENITAPQRKAKLHEAAQTAIRGKLAARKAFQEALAELRGWDWIERPPTGSMDRSRFVNDVPGGRPEHGTQKWEDRLGRPFAQANWKMLKAAVNHGYESSRITRLYDEIQQSLAIMGDEPVFLKPEEFPVGLGRLGPLSQKLLGEMRALGVQATTGVGETDVAKVREWIKDWTARNRMTLEDLSGILAGVERVFASAGGRLGRHSCVGDDPGDQGAQQAVILGNRQVRQILVPSGGASIFFENVALAPNVYLPCDPNQRYGMQRQREGYLDGALHVVDPARRSERLELSGSFQLRILLRRGLRRRTHLLPNLVGIAMFVIHAKMLDQHPSRRKIGDR